MVSMIRPRVFLIGLGLGVIVVAAGLILRPQPKVMEPLSESVLNIKVPTGATFSDLARWVGIATDTAAMIFDSAKDKYNLSKIVSGRELALTYDILTGELEKMVYKI